MPEATKQPPRDVLLIHGAGGGGWEWTLWRQVLQARGLRCHAPDWRPAADGLAATTLADYVEQMRAALQALPRPCALVGASLGGLVSAMLAADAGNAVARLVLVNPLPPHPWHALLPARDWPEVVPWRRDARLASTRRATPGADAASALWAFRHWRDESGRVLAQAQAGVEVSRPPAPVLFLLGGADADVPAAAGLAWAAAWSADVDLREGWDHLAPLFGPEAAGCAARVADWLSAG